MSFLRRKYYMITQSQGAGLHSKFVWDVACQSLLLGDFGNLLVMLSWLGWLHVEGIETFQAFSGKPNFDYLTIRTSHLSWNGCSPVFINT